MLASKVTCIAIGALVGERFCFPITVAAPPWMGVVLWVCSNQGERVLHRTGPLPSAATRTLVPVQWTPYSTASRSKQYRGTHE